MADIEWPDDLVPRTISMQLVNQARGLNQALSGATQVQSSIAQRWRLTFEFAVLRPDQAMAYRAFMASAEGRAGTLNVPIQDVRLGLSGQGHARIGQGTHAYGLKGAAFLKVDRDAAACLLRPGMYFGVLQSGDVSAPEDVYLVTSVDARRHQVFVQPRLRRDYRRSLIVTKPKLHCRLISDDVGEMTLEYGLRGAPALDMVEVITPAPNTASGSGGDDMSQAQVDEINRRLAVLEARTSATKVELRAGDGHEAVMDITSNGRDADYDWRIRSSQGNFFHIQSGDPDVDNLSLSKDSAMRLSAGTGSFPSLSLSSENRGTSYDFRIRADTDRAMAIDTHEHPEAVKIFADGNISSRVLGDMGQRLRGFDGTIRALADTERRPVGYGQDWTDVTSARAVTTTYTNSTGRPIQVAISGLTINSTDSRPGVFVQKPSSNIWMKVADSGHNSDKSNAIFIVPAGYKYAVRSNGVTLSGSGMTFTKWLELR